LKETRGIDGSNLAREEFAVPVRGIDLPTVHNLQRGIKNAHKH